MSGAASKARLERCEVAGNATSGVILEKSGDASLIRNTIRDHAAGKGAGLYVFENARGKGAVGADNVFLRNAGGDVVRQR